MSYNLKSLKGNIQGIILGTAIGPIKGDTRSLDNGSYKANDMFPTAAKLLGC